MEEYQLVFALWLMKFAVLCVIVLLAVNFIDRRWRAHRARTAVPESRSPLAMSRRRS